MFHVFARSNCIEFFGRLVFFPGLAFLFFVATTAYAVDERVALVIGNSAYAHVTPLDNPSNDAEDISAALQEAGFDVETKFDLDQQGMLRALQLFGQKSIGAEMAVIYYAGHGIEVDRRNYLIPVSAMLSTDLDVAFETVQLDRALLSVGGAKKLRLVIIDACRDNPFAGKMRSTSPTRSIGRGLAAVEPSAATLVAYAAKEGTVANDGGGRNSPYAAALIEVLSEPGLEIGKLFRRVRDQVLRETGGTQEPFVYGSIPAQDLFLYPASLVPEPNTEPGSELRSEPALPKNSLELAFWNAISSSTDPRDFADFIERFPNSVFAGVAARRLESTSPDAASEHERDEEMVALPPSITDEVSQGPLPTVQSELEELPFVTRDLLRSVQLQLNALGHNAGLPDGIMGRRTRSGISSFQSTRGLKADNVEIDNALLATLSDAISVDRASVNHYVLSRFGVSETNGRLRGLYCLENQDGTLADGKEMREMLCHFIRPSRGRIELRSYYSHVRNGLEDPVIGIITRLRRVDGENYVSDDGTPFLISARQIAMGPNRFLRVD